jgi:hypothetical protein
LLGIGDYSAELVMPKMGFSLDVEGPKSLAHCSTVKYLKNHWETIPTLKETAGKNGVIGQAMSFSSSK